MRKLFGGHAVAGIAEGYGNVKIVGIKIDIDCAAVPHGFERVLEQIEENLLHLVFVDGDARQRGGNIKRHFDSPLFKLAFERRQAVFERFGQRASG